MRDEHEQTESGCQVAVMCLASSLHHIRPGSMQSLAEPSDRVTAALEAGLALASAADSAASLGGAVSSSASTAATAAVRLSCALSLCRQLVGLGDWERAFALAKRHATGRPVDANCASLALQVWMDVGAPASMASTPGMIGMIGMSGTLYHIIHLGSLSSQKFRNLCTSKTSRRPNAPLLCRHGSLC